MLKEKRPDVEIVGDEVHPLLKVTDFSPYIAKIKASGADSVVTGNWGPDFALLLKAAADAGLQVDWYTYYAGVVGGPTAVKQTGLAHRGVPDQCGPPEFGARSCKEGRDRLSRQGRREPLYSASGQRDAHARQGDERGQVRRREIGRSRARGYEGRSVRWRRRVDAQGRSPWPSSRTSPSAASVRWTRARSSMRKARVGVGGHGRRRQGGGHRAADDLQDGSSLLRRGLAGLMILCADRSRAETQSAWASAEGKRTGALDDGPAHRILDAQRRALRHAVVHDGERPHAHLQHDGCAEFRAREFLHAARRLFRLRDQSLHRLPWPGFHCSPR